MSVPVPHTVLSYPALNVVFNLPVAGYFSQWNETNNSTPEMLLYIQLLWSQEQA